MERSARYPATLLAVFSLWWCLLAYAPAYRQDWLLENLLVLVAVPLLVWGYPRLRLSDFSYTLMFVFFCLHEIGAHYTYAEVPYAAWYARLTGGEFPATLGGGRNHFDRLVHFLYGLLMMPAVVELLQARATPRGLWRNLLPVAFVMSNSELFELIEWQAAEMFGGPLGQAYLGTQGDIWDAQKDSAMATLGAVLGLALVRLRPGALVALRQTSP
jgi:putative membrane protein